ncbi:MAG: hypothetical protein U5L96_15160 [Owenweeksia sp.]|nr:hypothetical protein [Owenweeksia sp.]
MRKFYPFRTIAVLILSLSFASAQSWTSIATDATGDEVTGLDGTEAHYYYDATSDSIWFKIDVSSINSAQQTDFGINVMVNIPGASNSFSFWGAGNNNTYHKLVTVWVTGTPPSSYTGTIGVADGTG